MQCHHIRNLSNKNYIFHDFLSTQQRKLGVIIFGSVRFLSKKVTKPNLKKKPKPNRNRVKPVWLGFFGLARFSRFWLSFFRFWLGFFRFWLGFFRCGYVISVWLGFDSVWLGFGLVFSSFFRFRFSSVFSVFFL